MSVVMIAGVYVWGALYAAGVFAAAIVWDRPASVAFALVGAAAAYVCQFFGALLATDMPQSRIVGLFALASCSVSVLAFCAAGTLLFW